MVYKAVRQYAERLGDGSYSESDNFIPSESFAWYLGKDAAEVNRVPESHSK
jgi:hypothetical protein